METKPQMLILSGLPASGKSTRAVAWQLEDPDARIRINWDDMRLARYSEDWRFNRKEENEMQAASYDTARRALKAGLSVVIDNTNLTPRARERWAQIGAGEGAEVLYEEVDTPVLECVRRDRLRGGRLRVGAAVIHRMALFHGFIDWHEYPNRFVLCDIDGTLSDPSHRLYLVKDAPADCPIKPRKDWNKFHELVGADALKEPIARLLGHFRSLGYHIIICSGRWLDKGCGKATEDWLERHCIQYDYLFMRAGSDSRSDVEVKREILELLPKDKIDYVLDDRESVCNQVWRANGLTCLQVAEGKF